MIPADLAFLSHRIRLYMLPSFVLVLEANLAIWVAAAIKAGLLTLFEDGSFTFGPLHGCIPWAICALGG